MQSNNFSSKPPGVCVTDTSPPLRVMSLGEAQAPSLQQAEVTLAEAGQAGLMSYRLQPQLEETDKKLMPQRCSETPARLGVLTFFTHMHFFRVTGEAIQMDAATPSNSIHYNKGNGDFQSYFKLKKIYIMFITYPIKKAS